MSEKRKAAYRQGIMVALALGVLTVVEFGVSQLPSNPAVWLLLIAFIKAGIIGQYFMHIYRLWRAEEH